MVLLVVLVTSILVPINLHTISDPVPPHTTSMPQPRSVVREEVPVVDGREREPFVAAERDRQREERGGGGGGRKVKRHNLQNCSHILYPNYEFFLLNFGKKASSLLLLLRVSLLLYTLFN